MMPEKMAEVKLAGEIERAGDALDGKPLQTDHAGPVAQSAVCRWKINATAIGER
jgi:hypothetical protein